MNKKTIFVFKGVVFDNDNRVLIVNRKEENLDGANGKWEVPGGKIEFGETPEEAVARELLEETGYKVSVNKIIQKTQVSMWEYEDYIQHTVIFAYKCKLKNDNKIEVHDKKINKIKWINPEEINTYNCLDGTKKFIEEANKI